MKDFPHSPCWHEMTRRLKVQREPCSSEKARVDNVWALWPPYLLCEKVDDYLLMLGWLGITISWDDLNVAVAQTTKLLSKFNLSWLREKKRHRDEYNTVFSTQVMTLFCKQSLKLLISSITWTGEFYGVTCPASTRLAFTLQVFHSFCGRIILNSHFQSASTITVFSWKHISFSQHPDHAFPGYQSPS